MSRKVCIIVLIGLPAAGKTTFCRWLLGTSQTHFHILHFCYDDFLNFHHLAPIELTSKDYVYKLKRSEIFKTLETIANSLAHTEEIPKHILSKIKISETNSYARDYIILCDDNHYYRSMRYKVYQLCKENGYGYTQVYIECQQQLSLERNAKRPLKTCLPNHVITQMAARFEPPLTSNIWESSFLTLYAEDLKFSMDAVLLLVFKALENIPQKTNKNVDPTIAQQGASVIHTLDIKLRRRISELLRMEQNKENKHLKAIQLNEKRKTILQKYRGKSDLETLLEKYVDLLNTT